MNRRGFFQSLAAIVTGSVAAKILRQEAGWASGIDLAKGDSFTIVSTYVVNPATSPYWLNQERIREMYRAALGREALDREVESWLAKKNGQ